MYVYVCINLSCIYIHPATYCNTPPYTCTHSGYQQRDVWAVVESELHHTATHCNTLQHTATHCNTPPYTSTHSGYQQRDVWAVIESELQHTATHCNTLQHTATHCNTLQHTATHFNTLPHAATHCDKLQYTAIHCNTLQHTQGANKELYGLQLNQSHNGNNFSKAAYDVYNSSGVMLIAAQDENGTGGLRCSAS